MYKKVKYVINKRKLTKLQLQRKIKHLLCKMTEQEDNKNKDTFKKYK